MAYQSISGGAIYFAQVCSPRFLVQSVPSPALMIEYTVEAVGATHPTEYISNAGTELVADLSRNQLPIRSTIPSRPIYGFAKHEIVFNPQ
jgi:hypothetical protein